MTGRRIARTAGASIDRAPDPLHLRRQALQRLRRRHARLRACSPTACSCSAARSSITVRAASLPRARRSRTRWSRSIAARRAARRTCARPRSSCTRASSPRARTAGRRLDFDVGAVNDLLSPLLLGRLLLQDVHVAARRRGTSCTSPSSAARQASATRRRSPIRTVTRSASRIATCWSSAPARPVSPPRWRPAATGARVILCDEQAEFGGSLLDEPAADDRRHAGRGLARDADGQACARSRTSRCCPARRHSAISRTTWSGWPSGSPSTCRRPPTARRASGCGRCVRQVVLATGAIERPLVFPGNDRPGVMLASARADLSAPLRRQRSGRTPCSSPAATRPMHAALDLHAAGVARRRRSPTCARTRPARCSTARRALRASTWSRRATVLGTAAGCGCASVTRRPCSASGTVGRRPHASPATRC